MVRGILAIGTGPRYPRTHRSGICWTRLLSEELDREWDPRALFISACSAESGEPVDLGQVESVSYAGSADTPFREKLFQHDLRGRTTTCMVDIPGEHAAHLWRGMWPMLLISALFMAIIVVAFVFTIRTIYRQKRIGDIRTDLVNNLTHELKTPISTIGLACEALSDPSMPKTEQQVRTLRGHDPR